MLLRHSSVSVFVTNTAYATTCHPDLRRVPLESASRLLVSQHNRPDTSFLLRRPFFTQDKSADTNTTTKASKKEKRAANKRIQSLQFDELAKMDQEEDSKDTEMDAGDDSEKPETDTDALQNPEDMDDDDDLPPGVMGEQLDAAFSDSKEAKLMVEQAEKEYAEQNLFKVCVSPPPPCAVMEVWGSLAFYVCINP
jgi:hypothetical protein